MRTSLIKSSKLYQGDYGTRQTIFSTAFTSTRQDNASNE